MAKRLTRSSSNRMVLGVCGGIADYFRIDPTLFRVGFVFVSFFSAAFPGILVYFVAAVIMPEGD